MNILVVEPSKVVRGCCVKIIESMGHTVLGASDGHEAIDALDDKEYDLCFINPQLPGNNGIELVYEIASYEDLRRTRLVLLADDPAMYSRYKSALKALGVTQILKRTELSARLLTRVLDKASV